MTSYQPKANTGIWPQQALVTMIKNDNNEDSHKPFSPQAKDAANDEHTYYYVAADDAAGDLSNDQVKKCYTWKKRGYPNEPIKIQKIFGRVLSDGSNAIIDYKLVDYIKDTPHQHRERKQQEVQKTRSLFLEHW